MRGDGPEAISLGSPAAVAYDAETRRLGGEVRGPDLTLRYGEDRAQYVDVWRPGGAGPHPMLVFWHGGAWTSGHPDWARFMVPAVTALPAVLVAPAYRLAPRCRWPTQLEDALAALRLLYERAHECGGDLERIAVAGHSAGGHLAAHAALRGDVPVRACLPVSAPLDPRYPGVNLNSDGGRIYRDVLADPAQDIDASPLLHLRAGAPRFHLLWGEADFERVAAANARFAARLEELGVPSSARVLEGAGHFDTHLSLGDAADPWFARVREALALGG